MRPDEMQTEAVPRRNIASAQPWSILQSGSREGDLEPVERSHGGRGGCMAAQVSKMVVGGQVSLGCWSLVLGPLVLGPWFLVVFLPREQVEANGLGKKLFDAWTCCGGWLDVLSRIYAYRKSILGMSSQTSAVRAYLLR